jgi:predicted TIM-barrel fold metal-dependent hydrolase
MNPVIDTDSHWTFSWDLAPDKGPMQRFAHLLPSAGKQLFFFVADTMLDGIPATEQPTPNQIFPSRHRVDGTTTNIPAELEASCVASDIDQRLAWMDRIGIDYSIVNSGGFAAAFPLIEDMKDRQRYCSAANDILAGELAGHTDRLGPVTYADLSDLDWAIGELTRMRALGSRVFAIRVDPVNGKSLSHPHFDRLWSAVTDLGMIVGLHIGLVPAHFGGWARLGLDYDTPEGKAAFLRVANAHRHQGAEMFLSTMVYGGVFARHPKLTVLVAELLAGWLPDFVTRVDILSYPSMLGPWPYAKTAGAYLKEQIRVSPLPRPFDANASGVLKALPEMVVFSSDYPHTEGNADPINYYSEVAAELGPDVMCRFMGTTMAETFARTGDPLNLA